MRQLLLPILLTVCETEPEEVDDHGRQHRRPRDGQVQLTIRQSRVQIRTQARFKQANHVHSSRCFPRNYFFVITWLYAILLEKQHICMETTHQKIAWTWNRRSSLFWSASNMTCACRFRPHLNAVSEIPSTCHLRAPARTRSFVDVSERAPFPDHFSEGNNIERSIIPATTTSKLS